MFAQEAVPLIHGVTAQGERVTLTDGVSSVSLSFPGIPTQKLSAQSLFIGAHLEDPTTSKFCRILLRCTYLLEWANRYGISESFPVPRDPAKPAVELAYKFPDEVKIATGRGTVTVTYTLHQEGDLRSNVGLRHTTWLQLDHATGLSVAEWEQQFLRPLTTLLTLASGRPSFVLEQQLIVDAESENPDDKRAIKLFYRTGENSVGVTSSRPVRMDMLFTLSDLEPNPSIAVDSWFRTAEMLDSVCGLFFGVYYNPRMFVEQRFLSMVSALESYHRRRIRNAAVSDRKHSERIDAIIDKAPPKYRKWLRYRLRYSNEPDLRQRLKDLADRAPLLMNQLIPDGKDVKRFLDKVAATRNYYTHYDVSLRYRAARAGDSLYWGSEILGILLTDCLLSELAIPPETRAQRIRERPNHPMIAKGVRRFLEA